MRQLTKEQLTTELGDYLRGNEIDGLLARRDRIVKLFEDKIARLGEENVLFDLPSREAVWPVPPSKVTTQ
jgi:hypothetical protein